MAIALALGRLAGVQKSRRLVSQYRHAHVEQTHIDMLTLAGAVAHLDGRQNRTTGVNAGKQIRQGHAHALRAAAGCAFGFAGDAHHAAHGLDHQIVTSALGVGPGLAEAGDGAINQARIECVHTGVVQTVMRQAADLEVFDQDVALQGQLLDQSLALRLGNVDRYRAFVAVAGGEIAGVRSVLALRIL